MISLSDPRHAALGLAQFRYFLFYRFCNTVGVMMQSVIVGWQVYAITGDALALGMIGLAEVIPALSVALFAGHLADRLDKRRMALFTIGLLVLSASTLFVLSFYMPQLIASHTTWPIYAAVFVQGLGRGFLGPANFALLGQLVPKAMMQSASNWNVSIWQTGAIIGPAIGGLCYGYAGPVFTYGLVLVLMALGFVNMLLLRVPPVQRAVASEPHEDIWTSISAGLRFVFGHEIILAALALDLFAVLFGGATALLPIFADEILKAGPEGLGILRAAPSLGAVLLSFVLTAYPIQRHTGRVLLGGVAGFGVCMIAFALSTHFYLSVFLLFLSGAFDAISVQIRFSILQHYTPDAMRGRVSSVNSMFIGSSNEIGAFESGVTAKLMGAAPSVVLGGVLTLLVVAYTAHRAPALRRLHMALGGH